MDCDFAIRESSPSLFLFLALSPLPSPCFPTFDYSAYRTLVTLLGRGKNCLSNQPIGCGHILELLYQPLDFVVAKCDVKFTQDVYLLFIAAIRRPSKGIRIHRIETRLASGGCRPTHSLVTATTWGQRAARRDSIL